MSSGIVPKALLQKPELSDSLTWYYDEFNNLSHDRTLDQGHPTPLSTAQIREYCEFFEIESRQEFHRMIRLIDRIYLEKWYAREKAKNAK